ncbi:MAG TPA: radical SAM protein, partial [Candidatus Korarchaeota archaeon]|nr:radical SAM protein [Candidatus Korarchaeota archaeon]
MIELPYGSLMVRGKSPSCEICWKGGKLVLFVTGLCPLYSSCFYCTISPEKRGRDLVFADEMEVKGEKDVLREARLIEAEGAGITGGEPTLVMERVCRYIRILKENFGREFDIHLYTNSVGIDLNGLKRLDSAGLDEIRFHTWKEGDWEKIRLAVDFNFRVGAEMPAIPGRAYERKLIKLARFLDSIGAYFLNLNELEFSDGNRLELLSRGYHVRSNSGVAVSGSKEAARRVLSYIERETGILGYFCSADVKELQVLNRWRRRAKNVAKPYQCVTDQGTLLFGVIRGDSNQLLEVKGILEEQGYPLEFNEDELLVPADLVLEMQAILASRGLTADIVE